MTEKEAIEEINKYSKIVDENNILSDKFIKDFNKFVISIPSNFKQIEMIKKMGDSGAEDIVNILSDRWDLE